MNLIESSFLCLDIGTNGVRAIGNRVHNAKIVRTAQSYGADIRSAVAEVEGVLGKRFDSAYITGNFGNSFFKLYPQTINFNAEHLITSDDVSRLIMSLPRDNDWTPIHIIPLQYKIPGQSGIISPIGNYGVSLTGIFGVISNENRRVSQIINALQQSYLQPLRFFDTGYLIHQNSPEKNIIQINLGSEFTDVSMWTKNGPVFIIKVPIGGDEITNQIAKITGLDNESALRIKHLYSNTVISDMDRFVYADSCDEVSLANLNEIVVNNLNAIVDVIVEKITPYQNQYKPNKILLSGGGCGIRGIAEFFELKIGLDTVVMGADAGVNALSTFIWNSESARREKYQKRQARLKSNFEKLIKLFKRKRKKSAPPIMPGGMAFDMKNPNTYKMFENAGIVAIHIDITDGFFSENNGTHIEELKNIRQMTRAHLHVHLMTENPAYYAETAIKYGANTIILSGGTYGMMDAIKIVIEAKRRVGIAVSPNDSLDTLTGLLRKNVLDEIMIMAVIPGASGQKFMESALHKIRVLKQTRDKYKLKFKISVDGGINAQTAKMCWDAGADVLVSSSYLANAPDFGIGVNSLLQS